MLPIRPLREVELTNHLAMWGVVKTYRNSTCPACPVYNEEIGVFFCGGRLSTLIPSFPIFQHATFSGIPALNSSWYKVALSGGVFFEDTQFRSYLAGSLFGGLNSVEICRNICCATFLAIHIQKTIPVKNANNSYAFKTWIFLGGTHHFAMFRPSGTIFNPLR